MHALTDGIPEDGQIQLKLPLGGHELPAESVTCEEFYLEIDFMLLEMIYEYALREQHFPQLTAVFIL